MTVPTDGIVLDASSVLAWCFEDEGGPESDALIERVAQSRAAVPPVWPLEIANALVVAERRGRLTAEDSTTFIALIEALPVTTDTVSTSHVLHETIALAREHTLSSYDAAYLELALRTGLPLATGDNALRRAAERCGHPLV